jgi:hypothetical protein
VNLALMGTKQVAAVNGYDPVYAGNSAGDGLVINPVQPLDSGGGFASPVLFGADPVLKGAPAPAAPASPAAPSVPVARSPRLAMQPQEGVAAAPAGSPTLAPAADPKQLIVSAAVFGVVLIVLVLAFARSTAK